MRKNIEEAKKHLRLARELATKAKSPLKGLTLEQAIKRIRKTREELWEEKLAARP